MGMFHSGKTLPRWRQLNLARWHLVYVADLLLGADLNLSNVCLMPAEQQLHLLHLLRGECYVH